MESSIYVKGTQTDSEHNDFDFIFRERNNSVTNSMPHPSIMKALSTNDETEENKQIADELAKRISSESSQNLTGKRVPMHTVRYNNTGLS